MSRQTNFWTDPGDAAALHAWLLQEFPGLQVIRTDRGRSQDLEPVPAEGNLGCGRMTYLVPEWAGDKVRVKTLYDDWVRVLSHDSPVIEYIPSVPGESVGSVVAGRFYWCYEGEIAAEWRRQLDRLFRWVRKHSIPVPPDGRFRVFEHAARHGCVLVDQFGRTTASPPWPE